MAETTPKPRFPGRQSRRLLADATLDRVDICRHLLRAEPVTCRLALALRLLEQTADDVAELVAGADDDRELQAIRRAAEPLPRRARRRSFVERLDAVAFTVGIGLAVLGAFLFVMMAFFARWW